MTKVLTGNGSLEVDGWRFEDCQYRILPGKLGATGKLHASVDALQNAFHAPEVTLVLADGREATITVTSYTSDQTAKFTIISSI
jgi:hypothetical protein